MDLPVEVNNEFYLNRFPELVEPELEEKLARASSRTLAHLFVDLSLKSAQFRASSTR